MQYLAVLVFLILIPLQSLAYEALPEDVAKFLDSRKSLVSIQFAPGSAELTNEGRAAIDGIIEQLQNASPEEYIVRVEGFTSPEGGEVKNFRLSIKRARAVDAYLRRFGNLPTNRTLMGMGTDVWSKLEPAKQRRVEVALYENRFASEQWDAEQYLYGKKVGTNATR